MPEVQVYLAEGRSDDQKKAVMLGITEALVKNLGVTPADVTVQIVEAKLANKMKNGQTFVERLAAKK
jgi:4-oxalocrotonate tautomerase